MKIVRGLQQAVFDDVYAQAPYVSEYVRIKVRYPVEFIIWGKLEIQIWVKLRREQP